MYTRLTKRKLKLFRFMLFRPSCWNQNRGLTINVTYNILYKVGLTTTDWYDDITLLSLRTKYYPYFQLLKHQLLSVTRKKKQQHGSKSS